MEYCRNLWSAMLIFLLAGCERGATRDPAPEQAIPSAVRSDSVAADEQISQYIRCMLQDRDGNLWLGTTTDGACRYDGRTLTYFNTANQLGSDWVNDMVQDASGSIWFATRDGLVRYDGMQFTRYTRKDGLIDDHLWCLLLDRSGTLWCGTWEGVSRFDGQRFSTFPLPPVDLSKQPYYDDRKKINAIAEDANGKIWFATNGGGAYRYDPAFPSPVDLTDVRSTDSDGSALTRFRGLPNDFVQSIIVDHNAWVWFGTRGGVTRIDRTSVPGKLIGENVGLLYEDQNGHLWLGITATGLCRSDHTTTTCYNEQDGAGIRVPMCMLEDRRGQLWIGTGAGLYLYASGSFINVTKEMLLRTEVR